MSCVKCHKFSGSPPHDLCSICTQIYLYEQWLNGQISFNDTVSINKLSKHLTRLQQDRLLHFHKPLFMLFRELTGCRRHIVTDDRFEEKILPQLTETNLLSVNSPLNDIVLSVSQADNLCKRNNITDKADLRLLHMIGSLIIDPWNLCYNDVNIPGVIECYYARCDPKPGSVSEIYNIWANHIVENTNPEHWWHKVIDACSICEELWSLADMRNHNSNLERCYTCGIILHKRCRNVISDLCPNCRKSTLVHFPGGLTQMNPLYIRIIAELKRNIDEWV